jgi:hypothetical protein
MTGWSRSDPRQLRDFGAGLGVAIAAIFGGLLPWLGERPWPTWPWVVGVGFVLAALVAPRAIWPVHRILRPVLQLLARVNNWVLLGVLFFGILWPVGWVLRRTGRLQYRTGRDPAAASYRVPVDRSRVTRLEEPF